MTIRAAAALTPEYDKMDEATRAALAEMIKREIEGPLRDYLVGDEVAFTMTAHIAVGYA